MRASQNNRYKLFLFFAEIRVDFEQVGHSDCGGTTDHGPDEKILIPDGFLYPSCCHSGKHHPKSHKTGADTIMGCAVFPFREINEIKHVGCEAEPIAELLDEHADVY